VTIYLAKMTAFHGDNLLKKQNGCDAVQHHTEWSEIVSLVLPLTTKGKLKLINICFWLFSEI